MEGSSITCLQLLVARRDHKADWHFAETRAAEVCLDRQYPWQLIYVCESATLNPQIRVSYRCLPAHLLEPKERPFFCHSSEANGHEFRVGCCSDEDSCNGNLTVTLSPEPIIGKEQRGTDSTEWLFSSLPSCEIFNVFCVALTMSF